jgi:hypothetical protein
VFVVRKARSSKWQGLKSEAINGKMATPSAPYHVKFWSKCPDFAGCALGIFATIVATTPG